MRIAVETGGFTSAADACRTGNQISALLCESLAGKLGGYAGMAGDDATSAEFAASYDEGARQALSTLAELTHAFIGLGRLLTASGANHRRSGGHEWRVRNVGRPTVCRARGARRLATAEYGYAQTARGSQDPANHAFGFARRMVPHDRETCRPCDVRRTDTS